MKAIAAALALLASASCADAQGLYMLNGRATPSVIIGPDGRAWPVVPGPQYAGPSPLILAQPYPAPPPPAYGYGYGPPIYGPPVVVYADPLPAIIGGIIAGAVGGRRRW
jgi:hypothetical protein